MKVDIITNSMLQKMIAPEFEYAEMLVNSKITKQFGHCRHKIQKGDKDDISLLTLIMIVTTRI